MVRALDKADAMLTFSSALWYREPFTILLSTDNVCRICPPAKIVWDYLVHLSLWISHGSLVSSFSRHFFTACGCVANDDDGWCCFRQMNVNVRAIFAVSQV